MTNIYTVPEKLNLVAIKGKDVYNQLTSKEKNYVYNMYKASWAGALIVARQTSVESEELIRIIKLAFNEKSLNEMKAICKNNNISDINVSDFLNYFAMICGNLGNYRSYGDTKIIPRLDKLIMIQIFNLCFPNVAKQFTLIIDKIYSIDDNEKLLGYPPNNTSGYFSNNLTKEEIDVLDKYVIEKGYEGWNTCADKIEMDGNALYVIKIASAQIPEIESISVVDKFNGYDIVVSYGCHDVELANVVKWLNKALPYVENDIQKNMIEKYIQHFTYGKLEDHKESQKYWIQDKGPVVETNMGFIENYRDPAGIRSEFESFVAIVDKDKSKKLKTLVDNAPEFLKTLPWPKEFEKDTFNPPDFTSLDILTFCSCGIPSGINIPNYDDIRMNFGFKNVSLDNIIGASSGNSKEPTQFLTSSDDILFKKYHLKAFSVDVAGHELLGHGSGKLLVETNGEKNFSPNIINPLTNKPVDSWYKNNETWSSKFSRLASTYEECRAECVGLYLSCNHDMHKIFGHGDEWEDIMYVSWLWMIKAGIVSLLQYNPEKQLWTQAHCQARYVIYKVLLEAGNSFISIEMTENNTNFIMHVDRSKINSIGVPALKNFLLKLGIYKSTGDYENGSKLYEKYSQVNDSDIVLRNIYINRMKPRVEHIQPTFNENLEYIEYEETPEGMILSIVEKIEL